jgi:hypothetical protein
MQMYLDITREVQKRIAKLDHNGDVAGPVQVRVPGKYYWISDWRRAQNQPAGVEDGWMHQGPELKIGFQCRGFIG